MIQVAAETGEVQLHMISEYVYIPNWLVIGLLAVLVFPCTMHVPVVWLSNLVRRWVCREAGDHTIQLYVPKSIVELLLTLMRESRLQGTTVRIDRENCNSKPCFPRNVEGWNIGITKASSMP